MTEPECVLSSPQLWHRWPDFLLVTGINGFQAGWGCAWCCSLLFSIVYGCDQLVVIPTHARGGTLDHRVDSVIESSLLSEIIWAETFVRWRWMITNQFLKIWLLSVNIINFKKILLTFLILRYSRINGVRLQNLYLALCKHSL